jgi:hypothetical protein
MYGGSDVCRLLTIDLKAPERHLLQPLPSKSWFGPVLISKPERPSQRFIIDRVILKDLLINQI